jgi:hypothetical protein
VANSWVVARQASSPGRNTIRDGVVAKGYTPCSREYLATDTNGLPVRRTPSPNARYPHRDPRNVPETKIPSIGSRCFRAVFVKGRSSTHLSCARRAISGSRTSPLASIVHQDHLVARGSPFFNFFPQILKELCSGAPSIVILIVEETLLFVVDRRTLDISWVCMVCTQSRLEDSLHPCLVGSVSNRQQSIIEEQSGLITWPARPSC